VVLALLFASFPDIIKVMTTEYINQNCPAHPQGGFIFHEGNEYVRCAECGDILWTKDDKPQGEGLIPDVVEEKVEEKVERIRDEIKGMVGGQELSEFQKFAFKGRMMEMAIAFMLGASFTAVVHSIAGNLLMPFINYMVNFTGTEWRDATWEPVSGLIFETGKFGGAFLDFMLMAIILYILYVKIIKKVVGATQST
jgi:large conductance mechanosensitive channel